MKKIKTEHVTDNRAKLRQVMAKFDLSHDGVAMLLGRQVTTVHQWTANIGQQITNSNLELLQYKLHDTYTYDGEIQREFAK